MTKVLPVCAVEGRHTMAGAIEPRLSALNGKWVTIAITPSFADKVREVLRSLRGEPGTTAIETLPPASWKTLKAQVEGEPPRSGGFRVASDPANAMVHLQVAQSDGAAAEIPMDRTLAARLIEHLGKALDAVGEPTGSA